MESYATLEFAASPIRDRESRESGSGGGMDWDWDLDFDAVVRDGRAGSRASRVIGRSGGAI